MTTYGKTKRAKKCDRCGDMRKDVEPCKQLGGRQFCWDCLIPALNEGLPKP